MALHSFGDSGEDHSSKHHGGPEERVAMAQMMERECVAEDGTPEAPCFCYHLGDVIYPGGDEAKYEDQFHDAYRDYGNAIVANPGNHDCYGDRLWSFKRTSCSLTWCFWRRAGRK